MIETYPALVGLVLGSLSPLVIAFIQQPRWTARVRAWVSLACAALIGVATAYSTGDLTQGWTAPATIAAVFIASQGTYRHWVKSGLLRPIEIKTSPGGGRSTDRL